MFGGERFAEVNECFGSRDHVRFKRVAGLLTPESPALLRDIF